MDQKKGFIQRILGGLDRLVSSKPVTFVNESNVQQPVTARNYNIPPAIPKTSRDLFIREAQRAGITPEEFSTIVRREQGANTPADRVALVGGVDPEDRGVMQVNKINEPLIRKRFQEEYGREYDPYNTDDSIIGAGMVLQENRRIFEQMKKNKTLDDYTSEDLVNSYNLGPSGVRASKRGDASKIKRLNRYEGAGLY